MKFNNSLLNDVEYTNEIDKRYIKSKKQYILPVHNTMTLHNIPESDPHFIINDQLFLDTLLIEIRRETISYSSHTKKQNDKKETQIAANILPLEQNLTEDKLKELEKLKLELTEFRQTTVKKSSDPKLPIY